MFCDRQTTLFCTLLYDTILCRKLCDVWTGKGGLKHNVTMTLFFSKIVWRCPLRYGKLKANRASETEQQRKESLRIGREKDRTTG